MYREFLDPAYRDEFDAWREKYKNPFRDLQDGGRIRNWDDDRRNADLEAEGIVGEVVFPNTVPPFFPSFVLFARPPRPEEFELRLAGIRAHNRWMADFCGRFPERRAGIGQIFLNDVDEALKDIQFIADNGLRGGILISAVPPDIDYIRPLYDTCYDPIWEACAELGLPVNSHGGTGLPDYGRYPAAALVVHHRGQLLLTAPVLPDDPVRGLRTASRPQVRHDRDGRGVAAPDARPLRPGAGPDP